MRTRLLFIVLSICCSLTAQINQTDGKGKKHGKHKLYLDKYWNTVSDSMQAVYFKYTYYDHGLDTRPFGKGGSNKLWKMRTQVDTAAQKGIKILNGDYRWHDPKGRLMYWHVFKDGEYVMYKEFYETGELHHVFDCTKQSKGEPWSWYKITYDKKGNVISENFVKKDEKGNWPLLNQ